MILREIRLSFLPNNFLWRGDDQMIIYNLYAAQYEKRHINPPDDMGVQVAGHLRHIEATVS